LGAGYTVMHARGFAHGLSREQEKRAWQGVIRELAEYAGGHSMLLAVENADALSDLKELANLVREIDSEWLRITLDIGHAFIRKVPPLSGYPVKELVLRSLDTCLSFSTSSSNMPYHEYGSVAGFIRAESDLIAVVHIHDNNGRQDHLLTGDGKIDFSFMKELKERFKGTYIFESNFVNHEVDFRRNYEKFRGLMSL